MCDVQGPTAGADSEYVLRAYVARMCDRFDPDLRFTVRIPKALGKYDASNQARELHPGASLLHVWEDRPK